MTIFWVEIKINIFLYKRNKIRRYPILHLLFALVWIDSMIHWIGGHLDEIVATDPARGCLVCVQRVYSSLLWIALHFVRGMIMSDAHVRCTCPWFRGRGCASGVAYSFTCWHIPFILIFFFFNLQSTLAFKSLFSFFDIKTNHNFCDWIFQMISVQIALGMVTSRVSLFAIGRWHACATRPIQAE